MPDDKPPYGTKPDPRADTKPPASYKLGDHEHDPSARKGKGMLLDSQKKIDAANKRLQQRVDELDELGAFDAVKAERAEFLASTKGNDIPVEIRPLVEERNRFEHFLIRCIRQLEGHHLTLPPDIAKWWDAHEENIDALAKTAALSISAPQYAALQSFVERTGKFPERD